MEFLGIKLVVLVLSVINDIKHINYIYDPYIILYYFFFYASVHFLNYTFLRINNYHYKHHKSIESNYFPDICDIIFNTKYNNNTDYIENTDHWVFNIIGSATNQFNWPRHIVFDSSENLYVADTGNHRVMKWEPGASEGTVVAGGNGSSSGATLLKPAGK
jgi:hypothetical protein